MTDKPDPSELRDKRDDVIFCLDMLEKQAKRLGLPEVQELINAAGMAAEDIEIQTFSAVNENKKCSDNQG